MSEEEEEDEVSAAVAQVRLCPGNAQMRLELALALESAGDLRRAYAEAQRAKLITPTYGRAWRLMQRLEKTMTEAGIDFDVEGLAEESESTEAQPRRFSSSDAEIYAAEHKQRGNEAFLKNNDDEAILEYGLSLEALKDAKTFCNRSAVFLKRGQNVAAAKDARQSIEIDPNFWKGHWYLGQALLGILKASPKGKCTANAERAQEAYRAFDQCLKCETLPANKYDTVKDLKDKTQNTIYDMADQENCRIM